MSHSGGALQTDTYDPVTGTLSRKAGVTYAYRDPAHRQAVTHRNGTLAHTYDPNGNMTWRRVWGTSASLTYDEENHLTGVSGGASASYVYDGDGQLVKATVGVTTTISLGNYFEYEVESGTLRKYYYADGQRVAMRERGIPSWLLGDHLGSLAITADAAGTQTAERRYSAWGWPRYSWGTLPTTFRYTGQRQFVLGLYYYGARWYDSATGRFIQPDPIVPEPGNPLAYDRYAYALNNPVRYTDPTGHWPEWYERFMGAAAQWADDVTLGAFSALTTDLDLIDSEAFQEGRTYGRQISTIQAGFEIAQGTAAVAGGVSSLPPTAGGTAACAAATGGLCALPGGLALTAESAMVAGGTLEAGHGLLMMAKIQQDQAGMLGAKGTQVTSKTLWQGKQGRLDVENPNPGKRPGQIHFQQGKNKWLYDPETKMLRLDQRTGAKPPRWLDDLLGDERFQNAIQQGLKYLGEE